MAPQVEQVELGRNLRSFVGLEDPGRVLEASDNRLACLQWATKANEKLLLIVSDLKTFDVEAAVPLDIPDRRCRGQARMCCDESLFQVAGDTSVRDPLPFDPKPHEPFARRLFLALVARVRRDGVDESRTIHRHALEIV